MQKALGKSLGKNLRFRMRRQANTDKLFANCQAVKWWLEKLRDWQRAASQRLKQWYLSDAERSQGLHVTRTLWIASSLDVSASQMVQMVQTITNKAAVT